MVDRAQALHDGLFDHVEFSESEGGFIKLSVFESSPAHASDQGFDGTGGGVAHGAGRAFDSITEQKNRGFPGSWLR